MLTIYKHMVICCHSRVLDQIPRESRLAQTRIGTYSAAVAACRIELVRLAAILGTLLCSTRDHSKAQVLLGALLCIHCVHS